MTGIFKFHFAFVSQDTWPFKQFSQKYMAEALPMLVYSIKLALCAHFNALHTPNALHIFPGWVHLLQFAFKMYILSISKILNAVYGASLLYVNLLRETIRQHLCCTFRLLYRYCRIYLENDHDQNQIRFKWLIWGKQKHGTEYVIFP